MRFNGPGSSFELLFEEDDQPGTGLPSPLREIYRGDWKFQARDDRPYSFSNFVISHDGKVSFNIPGHEGGGDVSGFNLHDQWIMALARSVADAVVVGANTLRTEHEHQWTAEFIFPSDGDAFAQFRAESKRTATPLQVIVSQSGEIKPDARIFTDPRFTVIIATTSSGAQNLAKHNLENAEILDFGDQVDIPLLYKKLRQDYGCETVLCEGGPRLYASVVSAGLLDEEFLTLSPVIVGSTAEEPRPSLLEGMAFQPGNNLRPQLQSVRKAGNHLFLRTRWS